MVPRITATIESVRNALAVMEIDRLIPIHLNGTVIYRRAISVEPVDPEWEIELA
jgi:hypothetical protein